MTNDQNHIQDEYFHDENLDKKLMDHDYDGIKELDNPAPAWIVAIFYISIFFSVMYGAYYFWFGQGPTQDQEYLAEVNEYNTKFGQKENNAPEALTILTNEADIAEGMAFYQANCVACHGANGEGGVGSNLTDANWIHGCDIASVAKIVKDGGPNGMMSYKQHGDKKIQQVASYVLTKLKGTNKPGKELQGEACQ